MINMLNKKMLKNIDTLLTSSNLRISVIKGQSALFRNISNHSKFNESLIRGRRNFTTKQENPSSEKQSEQKTEEKTEENKEEKTEEQQGEEEVKSEQVNYKTSRRIRKVIGAAFKYCFIFGGILFLYNSYLYYTKDIPSQHFGHVSPLFNLARKFDYFRYLIYGSLTLPYYKKVLPDPVELVGQPSKKTLVINLNKTLINYQYKFGSGFEILKRPGLLKFLQEMGQAYEVVIFGTEDSNFVEEVSHKLDQFEMNIRYKLGKEATRLEKGRYIKDLNYLNRDLKSVIVIDFDPLNVKYHPNNVMVIPEFSGDGTDRELVQSIVFLKEMAKPEIKDVRKEIEKYGNYKTYINFYKSSPKYKRLLPKEENVLDDSDLQEVIKVQRR